MVNFPAGELCDDGNTVDGDYCPSDCSSVTGVCGDGVVQGNEACDDGNTVDGDGCSAACSLTTCGDGVLEPGELCEVGPTGTCTLCVLGEGPRGYGFLGEAAEDNAGYTLEVIGDYDLDGGDDFLVGATRADAGSGRVYLVSSAATMAEPVGTDFSLADAHYIFTSSVESDRLGSSLATLGDLDNDGVPEIALGAYGNALFGENAGVIYVFLSSTVRAQPPGTTFDVAQANFTLYGVQELAFAGASMADVGDMDDDGLPELLVGTIAATFAGEIRSSYLILGSSLASMAAGGSFSLESADYRFFEDSGGAQFRKWVDSAGDIDGDGVPELLFGVPGEEDNRGRTHLMYGSTVMAAPSGTVFALDDADLILRGEAAADESGFQATGAGDLDGDGLGDLLVSALDHNQGAVFGGKVYVMLGSGLGDWPVGATVGLKAAVDYGIVGQAFEDHLGVTLASVGDMNADGTDDLVVTAYLNNHNAPVIGNSGKVYLFTGEQITTAAPGTVFDASWASASLLGANFFDNAGRRIAGEGDVDGDGRPDLIIAAYKNDEGGGLPEEGGDGAGKIYLVLNPY